jgi:signal transduction histidine kinase
MEMNSYNSEHERERLSALRRYSILDTPEEDRFDQLTKIAAYSLDMPIATLSFMDQHRQWFKSRVGTEIRQTSRIQSFCRYTLESGKTLIVPNLSQDERFSHSPIVTGNPYMRFYASTPLTTSEGFHIGTLCVMDFRPRVLLDSQIRILEHLARTALLELENDFNRRQTKETESLLRTSSRLASVGELAVGIAHEINNPLAVIQIRIDHLKRLALTGRVTNENALQCVEKVEQVVDRIHSIVRGLSTFARSGGDDPVQGNRLSAVIQDVLFFFEERMQGMGIRFEVEDLSKYEGTFIRGKTVQIAQAILNLLINAKDAVQDSTSADKWIRISFRNELSKIQIRVSDSAPSIPPEIALRLFQPFFTTKMNGKGTGLGLSVSRSLIESFGGKLYLDQRKGEKSFVIELLQG